MSLSASSSGAIRLLVCAILLAVTLPSQAARRTLLYSALAILFGLHNDLWLWNDSSLMLGLPVGLTYHLLYCVATAALMALMVRYAWPSDPGTGPTE